MKGSSPKTSKVEGKSFFTLIYSKHGMQDALKESRKAHTLFVKWMFILEEENEVKKKFGKDNVKYKKVVSHHRRKQILQ